MKTNPSKPSSTKRSQYSPQFKEQAVERANRDGAPKAAQDLGIAQSMLYNWVAKSRLTDQSFEDQKLQQAELARLRRENTRLKQELAFVKKAAAYLCPVGTSRKTRREVRHD